MQHIRNIIFDLGGVILNIDYHRTEQAFINLGVTDFAQRYTQFHATDLFKDFEKGLIEPAEFVNKLKAGYPSLTNQQITEAWNAMLLDFPPGRIERLLQLNTRYRTFVLSNTNAIHHQAFMNIPLGYNGVTLDECFEKVYYSHQLGMRKPDPEIYQYVLRENKLDAAETLFIADTPANVSGASAVGIESFFLEKPMTMEELLKNF